MSLPVSRELGQVLCASPSPQCKTLPHFKARTTVDSIYFCIIQFYKQVIGGVFGYYGASKLGPPPNGVAAKRKKVKVAAASGGADATGSEVAAAKGKGEGGADGGEKNDSGSGAATETNDEEAAPAAPAAAVDSAVVAAASFVPGGCPWADCACKMASKDNHCDCGGACQCGSVKE